MMCGLCAATTTAFYAKLSVHHEAMLNLQALQEYMKGLLLLKIL